MSRRARGSAPRPGSRSLTLALGLLTLAALTEAQASGPEAIPGIGTIDELSHSVALSVGPDGATLEVERSFHNPGGIPAKMDLPIELPCDATLDEVSLELSDGAGATVSVPATIVDADEGEALWDDWYELPASGGIEAMRDPDSALLMSLSSCEANLSVFPIPAFGSRTVRYRVFVPSDYTDGQHQIELPMLADYGLPATLELVAHDTDYTLEIDGRAPVSPQLLDGSTDHALALTAHDPGRARVSSADFDLEPMLAAKPSARALLPEEAKQGPHPRLFTANLAAPAELASLPPVRRAVLIIDRSRSLDNDTRKAVKYTAESYLEQLAADAKARNGAAPKTEVELLSFARDVEPTYHDFVPAQWAAEDFDTLDLSAANGSDLAGALAHARDLLAKPAHGEGADWIIVLSDLDLRDSFDYAAEAAAAAHGAPRLHVVGVRPGPRAYGPTDANTPWTAIAQSAGGMGWQLEPTDWYHDELAAELIAPQTIWNFGVNLAVAGGDTIEVDLDVLARGQDHVYQEYLDASAGLERATFHGEVWGQPRAWSAAPNATDRRQVAGLLATSDYSEHSDAVRTVLAHYAQVVTPYTSAFASVERDGSAVRPAMGFGMYSMRGHGCSCGSSCGGGLGLGHANTVPTDLETLTQAVLDSCPAADQGTLELETTTNEILAVGAELSCVREGMWGVNITPARLSGHHQFSIAFAAGQVVGVTKI